MKQIGIITFHNADNLGAVLQAYALQRVLVESFGKTAEIIDYRCKAIEATKYTRREKGLKSFVKRLPKAVYYWVKRSGFERFRKKYLTRSKITYTGETISGCNSEHEAFITGSDQVWNLGCSGRDDSYFLNFVSEEKKKFSYAASLGRYRFSTEEQSRYSELLNCFDAISVREKSAVTALAEMGIENTCICPDPVLLVTTEQWNEIMRERLIKDKYVLLYQILPDDTITKQAADFAKKHKLKLIHNKRSVEFIFHNSPDAFLSWVYHAEAVFTNSFHGTAFSLLFNRPLAVSGKMGDGTVDDRICGLLKDVGALSCVLKDGKARPYIPFAEEGLEKKRQAGMSYLQKICEEI